MSRFKQTVLRAITLTPLILLGSAVPALADATSTTAGTDTSSVFNPGLGSAPPGDAGTKFHMIISWGAWIAFGVCVAGVLYAAVTLAFDQGGIGRGGGQGHTRLIWALGGCIIAGSASFLVGALA